MNTTLFFLRSSEQKIAINILSYTNSAHISVYTDHYGLKNSDVGIYALTDNDLSGAAWIRLYKESDAISGYVNDMTPVLIIGIMPDARNMGVGSLIMEQLLQEAAVMYDQISVCVQSNSREVKFYERLGFVALTGSEQNTIFTMIMKLEKKAITRPTDGYDPRRWMD
jgi:GNAT superfamily N-acetyltransferase